VQLGLENKASDFKRRRQRGTKGSRRVKGNIFGGKREALYIWGGRRSILLEGAQATLARPSDKARMKVTTLEWWVVKA
jgi:hypothetical protein